jgi:hypothetical protein
MIMKTEILLLEEYDERLLSAAAQLHVEHLSYRSFITSFGWKFIREFYKDILADKIGFFLFAIDNEEIAGFILATSNSLGLFSVIKKRPLKYLKFILPTLLRSPKYIGKLIETFLYSKKENTDINAELVVIVTDSNFRGKSVGSQLITKLNQEFLRMNVLSYKVTVHDEMKQSNNFYIKNGMHLHNSFMMYGTKWNLYLKKQYS